MKFLIPVTLLLAGLSPLLNSNEGLDAKDLLLEDSYLNCGSREGRFKSFEIGRSGNVKAKSGLFSNYKITRKGEFFFLNGEKYPETKENFSYKNILTLNEKTFEEESGKLKLKNTTKIEKKNLSDFKVNIIHQDYLENSKNLEILKKNKNIKILIVKEKKNKLLFIPPFS